MVVRMPTFLVAEVLCALISEDLGTDTAVIAAPSPELFSRVFRVRRMTELLTSGVVLSLHERD